MPSNQDTRPQLRYDDRPDLQETFVDNVQRMDFDGRTLRIEFCVTRWDHASAADERTGRSIPISRMVLDLEGAVDLFNKINSLQAALESQGVIRTTGRSAPQPAAASPASAAVEPQTAAKPQAKSGAAAKK
jgi:hypothetical protein